MSHHRIGVCSWSLQPDGPESLLRSLRSLADPPVQLALSPLVDAPERWAALAQPDGPLTVVSGMMALAGEDYSSLETIRRTGGLRPDDRWDANRAHAAAVAEIAERLGLSLVTFHAGFLPESAGDPERAALLDRLRTVADLFGDRGIRLGLETGQESAETLAGLLTELERSNVVVNFDPANMILYDMGDPVAALKRLAPWVAQIHIKDAQPTATPGTWGAEVPVGAGAVEWDAFLRVAGALPTRVDLVIEREAGDDRLGDIQCAQRVLASCLEVIS